MKKQLVLCFSLFSSQAAFGQGLQQENLYAGAGFSSNSMSGSDDAFGYQFLGGYEFDVPGLNPGSLAVEVGFYESGDMEIEVLGRTVNASADGFWANAVLRYPLAPSWNLLGRAGLDFGDDDGLMIGGGVGYAVDPDLEVRGELVARDEIDSLQVNLVHRF